MGPPLVRSWIVESIIGALLQDQGPIATQKFIQERILSRVVDADTHFDAYVKMNKPRQMLAFLMKSLEKPSPVAR